MNNLSSHSEFNLILNDRERCIVLHSMEGEILGASTKACYELGYDQEEIVQLLMANIKALDLRLADVCLKHQEEAPVVFQRRGGRRFPAKVTTKVTRILRDRIEQNVVQLEFTILEDIQNDTSPLPKFDLQESANYLELLSQEIRSPLVNLGLFLEELERHPQEPADSQKLLTAVTHHQDLMVLTSDVADWFKLGTNILHLDKQPFNLVGLMDDIVSAVDQQYHQKGHYFSICLDNKISELVFGDIARVSQLLQRLLQKALSLHKPNQLRLSISPNNNMKHGDDCLEIAFSLIVHNYADKDDLNNDDLEPVDKIDTSLGIIGKLIKIMGGQLKQHRRSDVEYEYFFNLVMPDVDTLDIKSNPRFLSGYKVLLIDNDDSLLKFQLIQWGAEVEFFVNWRKADSYLSQSSDDHQYALKIIQPSQEADSQLLMTAMSSLPGLTVSIGNNSQCIVDKLGVSYVPLPLRPGLLGNALATLLEKNLPYPYSQNHDARIVDVRDERHSILFVDDVETIRLTFHALLEKAGFKVDLAQNGIDAILACDQNHYDLVIIDIQMPFMDGIEAASHIRNSKHQNQKTPILAVSGDISENSRFAVEKVGIQALHSKSAPSDEILSIIKRLMGKPNACEKQSGEPQKSGDLLRSGRRSNENDGESISISSCLNMDLLNNLVADTSLDICTEMVGIFMQESKESVAVIDEASQKNEWQQVKNEAHAIKSTSYTFGCEALYRVASQLEAEIEHGDLNRSMDLVDDMAGVFSQSYLALEDFFQDAGKIISLPNH